jgi:two-component system sensor histidine kinase PilS (NtrC family)
MTAVEAVSQFRWLMILRVVTVTTLLICAFGIELVLRPDQTVRPLFFLAAVAYGFVLLYAIVDRWLSGSRTFVYGQLIGDALVVTGFVWITGGIESPMSFLYLLPILVAPMLIYRHGTLVVAAVCWMMYASLALLEFWRLPAVGRLTEATEPEAFRVGYYLAVHLIAFLAVALLGANLSERLRATGDELAEHTGAVARLQALNENIIESINSGLITTDAFGRINFMNRGGVEITGRAHDEARNRHIEEFLELETGLFHEVRRQLLARRRFRFERYHTTPAGKKIFLGIAASNLYDRTGTPLGYIFIFQDLTEIQALEQEVRLNERMAAMGKMAAGMAHELRNPLAAISGSVQYLKANLEPDGEVLDLMDIILRESQRLDQTIRDFLTFARPGPFHPERADIVNLLEESLRLLRKSRQFAPDHEVIARPAAARIWCDIDTNRMKQIFWNLATNALKAMPDGGSLTIEVKLLNRDREIEICFADQGRGMTPAEMEIYFQPFKSAFPEGTGLGAAIIYRLVAEHGGRIDLESELGQGTRVRVIIPTRHLHVSAGSMSEDESHPELLKEAIR